MVVSLRNGCLPNVGVALNLLIPNLSEVDGLECWEVVEVRPCLASSSSINGVQCFIQFVLLCRFALSPVFGMDSICIELDNVGREVFPKATGILVFIPIRGHYLPWDDSSCQPSLVATLFNLAEICAYSEIVLIHEEKFST